MGEGLCGHLSEPQPGAGGKSLAVVGWADSDNGIPEAVGEGEDKNRRPRRGNEIKQLSG